MKLLGIRRFASLYTIRNTIVKDIIGYYGNDNIVREANSFSSYHDYPIETFYIACFVFTTFLILYSLLDNKSKKKEAVLKKLQDANVTKCINVFIIIFTVIFTNNIENAI